MLQTLGDYTADDFKTLAAAAHQTAAIAVTQHTKITRLPRTCTTPARRYVLVKHQFQLSSTWPRQQAGHQELKMKEGYFSVTSLSTGSVIQEQMACAPPHHLATIIPAAQELHAPPP